MRSAFLLVPTCLLACASAVARLPLRFPTDAGKSPLPTASEPALAPPSAVATVSHHEYFPGEKPVERLYVQWPLPEAAVTSLFGDRSDPVAGQPRFHYGVDLQSSYGALVYAALTGFVDAAGWHGGHGRQVVLVHPGGVTTVYSHLSGISVVPGMQVHAGQAIGQVGNSGKSTGPHLHFEVLRHGAHLNPLDVLGTYLAVDESPASVR